jgi:hypothetical protein
MGQKFIDWARPGKDIEVEAKIKLCDEKQFEGSQYLEM